MKVETVMVTFDTPVIRVTCSFAIFHFHSGRMMIHRKDIKEKNSINFSYLAVWDHRQQNLKSIGLVTGRFQVQIQDWKVHVGLIPYTFSASVFRKRHKTEALSQSPKGADSLYQTVLILLCKLHCSDAICALLVRLETYDLFPIQLYPFFFLIDS